MDYSLTREGMLPYRRLMASLVDRTIKDLRGSRADLVGPSISFFDTKWCDEVLGFLGYETEHVISTLEDELGPLNELLDRRLKPLIGQCRQSHSYEKHGFYEKGHRRCRLCRESNQRRLERRKQATHES